MTHWTEDLNLFGSSAPLLSELNLDKLPVQDSQSIITDNFFSYRMTVAHIPTIETLSQSVIIGINNHFVLVETCLKNVLPYYIFWIKFQHIKCQNNVHRWKIRIFSLEITLFKSQSYEICQCMCSCCHISTSLNTICNSN